MDGLAAIGSRIAEINAQLSQLSAPSARPATSATRAGAVAGTVAGAASGTTTGVASAGAATAPSFADVLAGAVQAGAAGSATGSPVGAATTTGAAATTTRTATTGAAVPALGPSGTVATTAGVAPVAGRSPITTTSSSTTGTTTTSTTSTGRLNGTGAPVELAHYGNGRIPASALESIGGGHRLWAPAAEAFQRLRSAAQRAGVHIGVTDSYRSYAEQVDVARRKGLHSQGGLAAKPGTSEHGWGKSLDLRLDSSAQRWMRRHADEYGFTENVSREPWHWTYAAR